MAIYRVRRFSVIEEEKSFGIIRDKLSKTIKEEEGKIQNYGYNYILNDRVYNPEVERKLISDNKDIAEFYPKEPRMNSPMTYFPDKQKANEIREALNDPKNDFTEDDIKLLTLLMNRNDKEVCSVYWDKCDGLETLAHELGHVENFKGNLLDRFINKGAKFGQKLRSLPNTAINSLLDVLGSKFINWEEQRASSKGYKQLEKYKLSPKDLKLAKENMDNALNLYKSQSKISWRRKLVNSKIPQWLL